jgi:CBS domain containing-hemolysin-like protein
MTVIAVALAGALVAVWMSGFYSGSETGLYCMDRLRLRVDAQRGDRRAGRIARLVDHQREALTMLLVGTNLANYVATVLVAHLLVTVAGASAGASEVYTTALVTPIIFVFGEVVPKTLYQRHADALMRTGSTLLAISRMVLHVPVVALDGITRPIVRLVDPRGLSDALDARSRVAVLLQEALALADATGDHRAFVNRVFGLSQIAVHQVMVPRNRVIGIRADATRRDLESLARKHAHSRLLVFERTPRRMTGYITVHELLADKNWTHVGQRARRVQELAAHDSVATALVRLQRAREALAAVVDRSGYLLGLVTRKDLLEELTGELPEW